MGLNDFVPIQIIVPSWAKWYFKALGMVAILGQLFIMLVLVALAIHIGWNLA